MHPTLDGSGPLSNGIRPLQPVNATWFVNVLLHYQEDGNELPQQTTIAYEVFRILPSILLIHPLPCNLRVLLCISTYV